MLPGPRSTGRAAAVPAPCRPLRAELPRGQAGRLPASLIAPPAHRSVPHSSARVQIGPGRFGYRPAMTDPNDDLSSVADPGSMGPDAMTEPGHTLAGSPTDSRSADEQDTTGVPGEAADSPAAQGSPVGPPD